jgi:hypothetical protein
MRVTVFTMPDGTEVAFAPHQRLALERSRSWPDFGFTLKEQVEGEPTFSDLEVALGLIGGYEGLTKIYRPPPQFRIPNRPYNLWNRRDNRDCAFVNFETALDTARELGFDVVQVPASDMERWFDIIASDRGITLLVV